MSPISLPALLEHGRSVLVSHYDRLHPRKVGEQDDTPDDVKLDIMQRQLSGRQGWYRNPDLAKALVRADNDLEAIESWIKTVGDRSPSTRRAYEKEAGRLLSWAVIEQGKPLSSLDIEDMQDYETFLKNPVSRHPEVTWISQAPLNPKTKRVRRGVVSRGSPEWRPFDGPLSPKSIDQAMIILKSMFAFWTDVGYTVVNPLSVRRKITLPNKASVLARVLSPGTWAYFYRYLDEFVDRIPDDTPPRERLSLLRQANQRYMVFSALYLLGTRISELASLKMSDFSRRYMANGEEQYFVNITGKGNKERTIPVPMDLMDVIAKYRRCINTFPVVRRGIHRETYGTFEPLNVMPSPDDDTTLIRSASGTRPVSGPRLAAIVKEALQEAKSHYESLDREIAPANVALEQLDKASAHWMRHTSATHQSLKGVSLRFVKDFLGHASYDTTMLYDHIEVEEWVKDLKKMRLQ